MQERIERLLPHQGRRQELPFPDGSRLRSVAEFCQHDVARLTQLSLDSKNLQSFQHADLHGDNVLLSDTGNVIVIDYGYSREGPLLMDATKLESDFCFHVTQLETDEELHEAFALSRALYSCKDVGVALPEQPPAGVTSRKLCHLWTLLRTIRLYGVKQVVGSHRSSFPLHLALLRYCLHGLTFRHYSQRNLLWILQSACLLAEDIRLRNRFQASHYRVYGLGDEYRGSLSTHVGMGALPGRLDREWTMQDTLSVLGDSGISLLILLTDFRDVEQLTGLTYSQYASLMAQHGIRALIYPILEGGAPNHETMESILAEVTAEQGNSLICSNNGLGRAGSALACIAKRLAPLFPAEEVIEHLARVRGDPRVVSTAAQRELVINF